MHAAKIKKDAQDIHWEETYKKNLANNLSKDLLIQIQRDKVENEMKQSLEKIGHKSSALVG